MPIAGAAVHKQLKEAPPPPLASPRAGLPALRCHVAPLGASF